MEAFKAPQARKLNQQVGLGRFSCPLANPQEHFKSRCVMSGQQLLHYKLRSPIQHALQGTTPSGVR